MWIKGERGGYINSHHLMKIYIDKTYCKQNGDWIIDEYIVKGRLAPIYDGEGDFVKEDFTTISSFDTQQEAEDYLNQLINEIGKYEEVRSI